MTNELEKLRIVIAPDSFKGSLKTSEVAEAMDKGVKMTFPEAKTILLPIADGGEGTVEAILRGRGGEKIEVDVTGPLGSKVKGYYGILPDGKTVVIEMAAASGITLVPENLRNPFHTTTYGTGELIKSAIEKGIKRIIIGIGGSATNDGGAGMAQALGIKLLDKAGNQLPYGGKHLINLKKIDMSGCHPGIKDIEIIAACDVENPLCGPEGASAIYGPQKGASKEMIVELDAALANMAEIIKKDLDKDVANIPGAGAAGGLGAGLIGLLGAKLQPGFAIIAELLELERYIKEANLIISGEGFIDKSTLYGKVLVGIGNIAQRYSVPVVAIGGGVASEIEEIYNLGIKGLYPSTTRPMTLEEAMSDAYKLITISTRNALELIKLGLNMKRA